MNRATSCQPSAAICWSRCSLPCRWSQRLPALARHQHASYAVLATAWALFSGPTRYISLATVGVLRHRRLYGRRCWARCCRGRWCCCRGAVGVAVALLVGLSTLRLSGVYFVIFTLRPRRADPPARDLVRGQVRPRGRPLHLPRITQEPIYWQLLALAVAGACRRLADPALAARLRAAHHRRRRDGRAPCGIDMTRAKLRCSPSARCSCVTGASWRRAGPISSRHRLQSDASRSRW